MTFTAVVIEAHLPSQGPINLGVLVLDETTNRLHIRFRTDLDGIADPLDREVIHGMPEMIESMAADMGAQGLLLYLEDCASNAVRLSGRVEIHADNILDAVEREFARHVGQRHRGDRLNRGHTV
jgi:hypothetical protein